MNGQGRAGDAGSHKLMATQSLPTPSFGRGVTQAKMALGPAITRRGHDRGSESGSWAGAVLGTVILLLFPSAGVGQVNAEVEAEHAAAVERIARVLLGGSREYAFPDDGGAWGFVIGRFEKGDEKTVEFGADVGEFYSVRGFGLAGADVDIRVFDPEGILIREDVLGDNVPVVSFTAESRGTYRAVMSAAAVTGGSSYAGMVVLRPPDLRNHGGNRS